MIRVNSITSFTVGPTGALAAKVHDAARIRSTTHR
jgi:hypothetical protein